MSDIKQVGDTGIYTAEGCVAGSVAASLALQRDKEREDYERRRCQIKAENNVAVKDFGSKFSVAKVISETDKFNGLMTAEEWAAARSYELDASKRLMEQAKQEAQALKLRQEAKKVEREKKRKAISSSLSFSEDLEVDNGEENNNSDGDRNEDMETSGSKRRLVSKNPTVDTAFLPDRARDLLLQEQKELLRQEWLLQQERAKEEMVEVTYSYWDGSGHRKSVSLKKGTSIGKFLEAVKQELGPEFKELRNVTSDNLMYIKEDLIISHHYSFYDLIVTKARGKSGPLFCFDVHDDVRLLADVRVEKDESHPGKVVERRWYEKNKHIFPASRWETYDPLVQYDRYSVK